MCSIYIMHAKLLKKDVYVYACVCMCVYIPIAHAHVPNKSPLIIRQVGWETREVTG